MYLHDWTSLENVKHDFEISNELNDANVLLASYVYENYSGNAFVLFERDGKLYEVNGSHCSCYGLEGQWEPEETTEEALVHRVLRGSLGSSDYNPFSNELLSILKERL